MNRYPPGVTGNEFAIAGPDYDIESDLPCPHTIPYDVNDDNAEIACGAPTMEWGYRNERYLSCDEGHKTELDDDPAYDR